MTEFDRLRQAHSETLSVVSHDIRAPLGVILGALTELANPQVGALNDDQRTLLQLVRRSSEKLSRLANNVMFLNRIESAQPDAGSGDRVTPIELARHPSDLRVVVRRAVEAFERSGELGKIALTTTLPEEAAMTNIDAERIGHLLANVVANALRFARKAVSIAIASDAEGVHLVVDDDGPGFVDAMIPTLFDRTLRPSVTAGKPPRGLGLVVVKGIVDAHDAIVRAENIPGDTPHEDAPAASVRPKGARIRVTFPNVTFPNVAATT